jgi:hypothetical protein
MEHLFGITLFLIVVGLAVAALFARRAPAVSFALLGAMVAGALGYLITDPDGPHWVPSRASIWASVGLAMFGLVGACLTRADPASIRFLERAGWVVLAFAPAVAFLIADAMASACPRETAGTGYCFYGDTDLFGGWGAAIMTMFFLDGVVLALLFWISAWQGRPERGSTRTGTAPR